MRVIHWVLAIVVIEATIIGLLALSRTHGWLRFGVAVGIVIVGTLILRADLPEIPEERHSEPS